MAKAWKTIIIIVLIAAIIGTVLIGIGLLTGAEFGNVFSGIAQQYGLSEDINDWINYPSQLWNSLISRIPPEYLPYFPFEHPSTIIE